MVIGTCNGSPMPRDKQTVSVVGWVLLNTNSGMRRVTDSDDIDAASTCSHRLTPCRRRVVRVAVRQNH